MRGGGNTKNAYFKIVTKKYYKCLTLLFSDKKKVQSVPTLGDIPQQ